MAMRHDQGGPEGNERIIDAVIVEGPCRALTILAGDAPRPQARATAPSYRADAAFLAHLLAVRTQASAQRAKRRAAPEVGAAAYRSGLGLLAAAPRRMPGREA
jgi:hypothetical protein